MRKIITAIAAITLVTSGAYAQGNGRGGGQGSGGGEAAGASMKGGGNANAGRGDADRGPGAGNRGGGNENRGGGNADRGGGNAMVAASNRGGDNRGNGNAARDERGNGAGNANAQRGNSGNGRTVASDNRGEGNANRNENADDRGRGRGNDGGAVIVDNRGRGNARTGDVVRVTRFSEIGQRGLIDGCPPGLAKKNPPCVPPGQVRNNVRYLDRPDFWGFNRLGEGRYFYDDGYLVRYAPSGGILGYIPLLGGALSLGNSWPSFYEPVALPGYYESYYGLGSYDSYRYADNVIYRVDPETAAITSIAALLTGDQFNVGQQMPLGYDVYNVPYSYRSQYADGPDAYYRYADGYVYQVDPETRLIAAAIELLAS